MAGKEDVQWHIADWCSHPFDPPAHHLKPFVVQAFTRFASDRFFVVKLPRDTQLSDPAISTGYASAPPAS